MESANVSVLRGPESLPGVAPNSQPRTLRVTATYTLSESGRKASLLAGGNGRAERHGDERNPVNQPREEEMGWTPAGQREEAHRPIEVAGRGQSGL